MKIIKSKNKKGELDYFIKIIILIYIILSVLVIFIASNSYFKVNEVEECCKNMGGEFRDVVDYVGICLIDKGEYYKEYKIDLKKGCKLIK